MGRKRNIIYDEAYKLYLSGLSLEQVANKIAVSRQCVFKAFKKRGLELRGPNFQPFQIYDGKKFSLRPNGYYQLTSDSRISIHRYIWEKEIGKIPNGYDIHHKNEIKSDNRIENYECLLKSEHTKKHGFKNNQYTKKR